MDPGEKLKLRAYVSVMPRVCMLTLVLLGCSASPEGAPFDGHRPSTPLEQAGQNSGGSSAGSSPLEAGSGGIVKNPDHDNGGTAGNPPTMPQAGTGGVTTSTAGTSAGGAQAGQGGMPATAGMGGQATAGTGGTPQGGSGTAGTSGQAGEAGMSGEGGAGGVAEPVCVSPVTYAQCTGKEVTLSVCSDAEFQAICGSDPKPWLNIAHPWVADTAYCEGDQVVDRMYGATGTAACSTVVYVCTDAMLCRQYAPNSLENSETTKGTSLSSGTWRVVRSEEYRLVTCSLANIGACRPCKNLLCN